MKQKPKPVTNGSDQVVPHFSNSVDALVDGADRTQIDNIAGDDICVDHEELKYYFKHCSLKTDKGVAELYEKMAETVDLRIKWLENEAINIHDNFSFIYFRPEMV